MHDPAEEYELFDEQPTGFARWIVPGLIISVLVHVIFYMWAKDHLVPAFSDAFYDRIVPRTFQVDRVEIDPALLEQPAEEIHEAPRPQAQVEIPQEEISFQQLMGEVRASPAAPPIENPLLAEKPTVAPITLEKTMETARESGAQSVVEDMDSLREELLRDQPEITGRPLLDLGSADGDPARPDVAEGPSAGSDRPGFSNLDSLLAQTGPLTEAAAPILMPADLLFEYDQFELQPIALSSLEKLGELILRNPQASFIIEGHTDSFGSEEYNLELSVNRAHSVKAWLVDRLGIDPLRIATRGFGKSQLIAPADGSIEEQQINRRVEIVIRPPETP